MKLYMKQDSFVWGRPLPVCDRVGHIRYTVTGDAFSFGKRLHVVDLAGRKAIYVRQRIPALLPTYDIEVYGRPVGTLIKEQNHLRPSYHVEPLNWALSGSLSVGEYELMQGTLVIAANHSIHENGASSFLMEFHDRATELTAFGVFLTLNCILAPQEPKTY